MLKIPINSKSAYSVFFINNLSMYENSEYECMYI